MKNCIQVTQHENIAKSEKPPAGRPGLGAVTVSRDSVVGAERLATDSCRIVNYSPGTAEWCPAGLRLLLAHHTLCTIALIIGEHETIC